LIAVAIPKTNAEQFPEVKKLLDQGLHSLQYSFSADDQSRADKLFRGAPQMTVPSRRPQSCLTA
jgi:Mn-containing catalase